MNRSHDFTATLPGFTFIRSAPAERTTTSVGLLAGWSARLSPWRMGKGKRPNLAVLNDHLLKDIGMNRPHAHLFSGKFDL
jgi:uncharacterized protein YjiS (DUF1127 family)